MRTEYWVRKAQDGDKEAFVKLMRDSEPAMYRAAKAILHREEDVEDAMQEAVCKAFQKLPDLRQPKYFKTWLTRILINCCYDLLRPMKNMAPLELLPEVESPGEDPDLSLDVRAALNALSENDRLVMTLFYLNDLPIKEIARLLVISESAVKQRLVHGREKFRTIYQTAGEEGTGR